MYEREIEDFEDSLLGRCEASPETVRTAIALMRAADPGDAEAELEHCEEAVNTWMCCEVEPCIEKSMQSMLVRERAAARAEGWTAGSCDGDRARGERIIVLEGTCKELAAGEASAVAALEKTKKSFEKAERALYLRINELEARLERLGYGPDEVP